MRFRKETQNKKTALRPGKKIKKQALLPSKKRKSWLCCCLLPGKRKN